ncbi:MAG: CRISPR-associated endonuclease Cas2 [Paludibacteraceae bacterium]|nr:CRISPR-associated endonuclease Cas2 [Paludibacteraceae bacterium]
MRKKRKLSLSESLAKIKKTYTEKQPSINTYLDDDLLQPIEVRARVILDIVNDPKRPIGNMLFFVMYDIESNKVRRHIAKYLIKKGCTRIQRSIFLADLSSVLYEEIKKDLAEVQAMYENSDSILIVPISVNYLESMKIIGQNLDIDIIAHKKNTLFF